MNRRVFVSALRAAVLGGVVLLMLSSCNPEDLPPGLRILVTGTTDTGDVTLAVEGPTEVTLEGAYTFNYRAACLGFSGTFQLALTGLVPEVELSRGLSLSSASCEGTGSFQGSFEVRAVATRLEPVDLQLTLTSVGVGGSVVVHPPVRLRLTLRPILQVVCGADPDSGIAPLRVSFTARPLQCIGPCRFSWDFGDGKIDDAKDPRYEYTAPGSYLATVTLSDGTERRATCQRRIQVEARDPGPQDPSSPPGPTPTPTVRPTLPPD
jgi:hypothetical protein